MPYSEDTIRFFVWRELNLPPHENKTPKFHYDIIEYYNNTPKYGFGLLQIFRGASKTQLSMEYALYCICEDIERYVLFVGSTQELANEIVNSAADLAGEIKGITVTRAVDGVLEIINSKGNHAYLVAKSTGSKLRGISKSGHGSQRQRPTAIVLDDIVSDDILLGSTSLKSHRAVSWLTGALFPTLDPSSNARVFGSGTPIKAGDPYMTLTEQFGCVKIPLTEDIWADRFTPEFIEAKKSQYEKLGQMANWRREYELILTDSESAIFDMKMVKYCKPDEVPPDLTYYMTLDGAFSEKDSADYSSFAILGVDDNGNWFVESVNMRAKPTEVVGKLFELQARCGAMDVGIEKGSWLLSMKVEVEQKMLDYQQYFNVVELNTKGSKISRIKALTHIVNTGRLTIIDNGEDAEMLAEQMELTSDEACLAPHDDAIDAVSQLLQLNIVSSDKAVDDMLSQSDDWFSTDESLPYPFRD